MQPQTAHLSSTLQRRCPVTEKCSLTCPSTLILRARSAHRQNRASQSHPSIAGDVKVERRTRNTSSPHNKTYSTQATTLILRPPAFPKDEGPEGHVCYSREEPQMADDIEGRAYFSGSGWVLLADSCCSNPWDEPRAQLPTGNFRYLQKAILNTM